VCGLGVLFVPWSSSVQSIAIVSFVVETSLGAYRL